MALLDRLGHASSLAAAGERSRCRVSAGRRSLVRSGVRPAPDGRMTFSGASVLVTGGSRGIGKAIALRFASLGRDARRDRLHARGRGGGGDGGGAARARRRARARRGTSPPSASSTRSRRSARSTPRPRRGDRRHPAGARDRGQALGLDALGERPRAALARRAPPLPSMPDGASSSGSRASARCACSTTTRSWAPPRPRSRRSSATSRSSSLRAGSA